MHLLCLASATYATRGSPVQGTVGSEPCRLQRAICRIAVLQINCRYQMRSDYGSQKSMLGSVTVISARRDSAAGTGFAQLEMH
jgi:hypothetical protein